VLLVFFFLCSEFLVKYEYCTVDCIIFSFFLHLKIICLRMYDKRLLMNLHSERPHVHYTCIYYRVQRKVETQIAS